MVSNKSIKMMMKVRDELKYIYKGGIYQNMLRRDYFDLRMQGLCEKSYKDNKNKILKMAVDSVKTWAKSQGVDFKPQFDKDYFKSQTVPPLIIP